MSPLEHENIYINNRDSSAIKEVNLGRKESKKITQFAQTALSVMFGTLIISSFLKRANIPVSSSAINTGLCFIVLAFALKFFSKSGRKQQDEKKANNISRLNSPPVPHHSREINACPQANEALSKQAIDHLLQKSHLHSFYPAKRPPSSPLDKEKSVEWINRHPEHLQSLATKFISSINHISQREFEGILRASVSDFNDHLSSLPEEKRDYTIILPEFCPRPDKKYDEMSNLWVTMLALPFLQFLPKKIIVVENRSIKILSEWNEGSKNAVLFDDAAYSGSQIIDVVDSMNVKKDITLHIIVPFMTARALERIQKDLTKSNNPHRFAKFQEIFPISDILIESEKETIKELLGVHPRPNTLATIYFDHKIADLWSVFSEQMKEGKLLTGDQGVAFIPQITPPYKNPGPVD